MAKVAIALLSVASSLGLVDSEYKSPRRAAWECIHRHEASSWATNTGNGYYGGLQFDLGTWRSGGGRGMPHRASRSEQMRVADRVWRHRGYRPWPNTARMCGLL